MKHLTTKRRRLGCLGTLSLGVALAGSAAAHHSYADFDHCRPVAVEGEIERVLWASPHVVFWIAANDGVSYRIEWLDTRRLTRNGVHEGAFGIGDRLAVTGSPHRDPERAVLTRLSDIRKLDAADWHWSGPQHRPSSCPAP